MAEAITFLKHTDRHIKLEPVLRQYYPGIDLGRSRSPICDVLASLESLGITIHHDTLGGMRQGSLREFDHNFPKIGELFLVNALIRQPDWSTPSVATSIAAVVETGLSLQKYNTHNVRKSEELTPAIAELMNKTKPEIISRMLRGIRIDGSYIASMIPEAWEKLREVAVLYAAEHESLPPTLLHRPEILTAMLKAKTPKELYTAFYGENPQAKGNGRRIASFVPYELEYWNWLIEQGILASFKHLPFTEVILNAHAKNLLQNAEINKKVLEETGVPNDGNIIGTRMRIVRRDFPEGFT